MKGKTAFQKIVESHLVKTLPDGRMVLKLDWVWGHEITTPNAVLDMQARGCDVVFNPNRIKTMIDHVNPAKDTASAIQGKIVREWSQKHDIEFRDVGKNNGVCHALIPESGWILSGQIGIMGDSHTCTHGAFCAFTAGVGTTELENGIITGLWICPPQKVIRVNFIGKLPVHVFAKDLILTLINKIGVKGATNAVLEFGGPVIEKMSMEGRMTITNMAVEAGATSGMMMVDEKSVAYLWPILHRTHKTNIIFSSHPDQHQQEEWVEKNYSKYNSDPDAPYDRVIDIEVTDMVPVITNNYSPGDVVKVSDLAGKPINQVYIGSCTNGRIEDLRIAASIFRRTGKVVADGVRCIIVPATQHIYEQAIKEGLITTFLKAGCYVNGPTCGACLGMSCGVLAPGEVCVSTTNRNFPGRMGKDGMVHLASPATAALTAVMGYITEPSIEMCIGAIGDNILSQEATAMPTEWEEAEVKQPDYAGLLAGINGGQEKNFSGKVFYLPADNIDTDQIIPAKYLTETKKEEFGKHCLEDAPISDEDRPKLYQSQILVAGDNFGCGSSREHAPWALEGAGIKCVIAPSFARIFYNNMFSNGLLCIETTREVVDMLFIQRPDEIYVDIDGGYFEWMHPKGVGFPEGRFFRDLQLSNYQKELIKKGGSTGLMLELAAELQKEGKL